jgi:hypothetical protein
MGSFLRKIPIFFYFLFFVIFIIKNWPGGARELSRAGHLAKFWPRGVMPRGQLETCISIHVSKLATCILIHVAICFFFFFFYKNTKNYIYIYIFVFVNANTNTNPNPTQSVCNIHSVKP